MHGQKNTKLDILRVSIPQISLLPTFNIERKAKFQLEVSENNLVFCQIHELPENYPWTPKLRTAVLAASRLVQHPYEG